MCDENIFIVYNPEYRLFKPSQSISFLVKLPNEPMWAAREHSLRISLPISAHDTCAWADPFCATAYWCSTCLSKMALINGEPCLHSLFVRADFPSLLVDLTISYSG